MVDIIISLFQSSKTIFEYTFYKNDTCLRFKKCCIFSISTPDSHKYEVVSQLRNNFVLLGKEN